MDEELILRLIETIETASERLWGIAYRQVYVSAFFDFLWIIGFAMVAYVLYRLFKYCWKAAHKIPEDGGWNDRTGSEMGFIFSGIGIGACFVFMVVCVGSIIGKFINPEYYAIKVLLDLVR